MVWQWLLIQGWNELAWREISANTLPHDMKVVKT